MTMTNNNNKKYAVKGMNGFNYIASSLKEAKKVFYNEAFRFENQDTEYAVIELAENGGWKKVLVEGRASDREQCEKMTDFIAHAIKEEAETETKTETKKFKAVRTVYKFNGRKKETVKEYETYEQAKRYAKRYSKISGKLADTANFVQVNVKSVDDDLRILYSMDSNGFENEYVAPNEEEPAATKYIVTGDNGFEFQTSDLRKARTTLFDESDRNRDNKYTVIEITENGVDVLVEGKVSNLKQQEAICAFVLGRPAYKVAGFYCETEQEAVIYAKVYANEKGDAVKIYRYGRKIAEVKPEVKETKREQPKIIGYCVNLSDSLFDTEEEAFKASENGQTVYAVEITGDCYLKQRVYHEVGKKGGEQPNNNHNTAVAEASAEYLTDNELISMLVKEPVNASLYDFMREPQKIEISKKGRRKLNAVREIVKRALVALPEDKKYIGTTDDAAYLMMKRLRYENKEYFYIIILDNKNRVVKVSEISKGSLDRCVVHPAAIFKEVLKYETASNIILCHNHPSGDPEPSTEDIQCTLQIKKAGKILGIDVLDHIIIGDGVYESLKRTGQIS